MSQQKFVRKLQRTSTHSYNLNIPKEIIDQFGWREKQRIEISFEDGKTELKVKDWEK